MAFCRSLPEKNRIARTNTWTSLEKGGNIKGNMMLVYSRFSVGTGKTKHAHPNGCAYSLRVMQFDLAGFIQTGEVTGGVRGCDLNERRLL
jgi:hypothetical protein